MQKSVAVLSTENEYIAVTVCFQRVRYFWHAVKEYRHSTVPSFAYEDNRTCISSVAEEGKMNMHIEVRYHVYRKAVNVGEVELEYCPSTE